MGNTLKDYTVWENTHIETENTKNPNSDKDTIEISSAYVEENKESLVKNLGTVIYERIHGFSKNQDNLLIQTYGEDFVKNYLNIILNQYGSEINLSNYYDFLKFIYNNLLFEEYISNKRSQIKDENSAKEIVTELNT